MKLTREIEEALGLVGDRQMTGEYYQREEQTVEVGSGNG
jgi:hypothetical protein